MSLCACRVSQYTRTPTCDTLELASVDDIGRAFHAWVHDIGATTGARVTQDQVAYAITTTPGSASILVVFTVAVAGRELLISLPTSSVMLSAVLDRGATRH